MKVLTSILLYIWIEVLNCEKHRHRKSQIRQKSKQNSETELNEYFMKTQHFKLKPSNYNDEGHRMIVKEYKSQHVEPSSVKYLGRPPNAAKLDNIYGQDVGDNPYGPQPKLVINHNYLGKKEFIENKIKELKAQNMTFDQIQEHLDQLVKDHSAPLYSKVSDIHVIHYKDDCDISKV